MKVLKHILFAGCTLLLFSCRTTITGSGKMVENTIEVSNFQNLALEGPIDVQIIGENAFKVKVVGDDNLIEYVQAVVKEGTLNINFKKDININDSHVKVVVSAPFLNTIESDGSGDITSDTPLQNNQQMVLKSAGSGGMSLNLNAPAVIITGEGSGKFVLQGTTKDLECSLAGSGDIDTKNMVAENAKIKIAGSGNARIFANTTLSANIVGSGDVLYYGNPSLSDIKVTGSGSVKSGQ